MGLCHVSNSVSLSCLHILQVVEGGGEVATRMTVGIGILEVVGAVTMAVMATGTGKVIEGSAVGRKVPLVAARSKTAATPATAVALAVAMATVLTTAMDRAILVLRRARWVPLVTKVSRGPLSLGACKGVLRMA